MDRDAVLLSAAKTLEAIESRMTRPTYNEDLLHFNDESVKTGGGARGLKEKARLDNAFKQWPEAKYDHVMKEARAQIGLDGKLLDDHLAIKKYFKEHVGMDRYKLATRFFEMMVEIHGAVFEADQERALGRKATVYQFIEQ